MMKKIKKMIFYLVISTTVMALMEKSVPGIDLISESKIE
jgi:hypothetical protein